MEKTTKDVEYNAEILRNQDWWDEYMKCYKMYLIIATKFPGISFLQINGTNHTRSYHPRDLMKVTEDKYPGSKK